MNKIMYSFSALLIFTALTSCTKKAPVAVANGSIEELQKDVLKTPSYNAYINLGIELDKAKRGNEALEAYNKAAAINPGAPLAWNNICSSLNAQGRYLEAAENCEKALKIEPQFELAQNNLKIAKDQLDGIKKSVQARKATVLSQSSAPSKDVIEVGMDFYNLKEYSTAIEIWNHVKSEDSLYAMAQNNLASAFIVTQQFDKAEKAINTAIKLEPKNERFANNKQWLKSVRMKK